MKNLINDENLWDSLLITRSYLGDSSGIVERRIKLAVRQIENSRSILNVGSGQGFLENLFGNENRRFVENWVSCDISTKGLDRISRLHPWVNTVKTQLPALSEVHGRFDCVVCMEVIEHLDKTISVKSLERLGGLLSEGGKLILSVPVYEPRSLKNHPVGHYRKYTPVIFEEEINDAGFKVIGIHNLYAFEKMYVVKSKLAERFHFRRPSVVMFVCQK